MTPSRAECRFTNRLLGQLLHVSRQNMRPPGYIIGALLGTVATACLADETAAVARLSMPLQPSVTHEQVLSDIKQALGFEAANCENRAAERNFEFPDCLSSGWGVHPFRAPQTSVAPNRSILTYGRALLQAASSTDMGPPRGPVAFQTMTIEVDTSSGAEAMIVVTTRSSYRSSNDWELKNALRKLGLLAQRISPEARKPKGDKD
jgi:hypothetical protein